MMLSNSCLTPRDEIREPVFCSVLTEQQLLDSHRLTELLLDGRKREVNVARGEGGSCAGEPLR